MVNKIFHLLTSTGHKTTLLLYHYQAASVTFILYYLLNIQNITIFSMIFQNLSWHYLQFENWILNIFHKFSFAKHKTIFWQDYETASLAFKQHRRARQNNASEFRLKSRHLPKSLCCLRTLFHVKLFRYGVFFQTKILCSQNVGSNFLVNIAQQLCRLTS